MRSPKLALLVALALAPLFPVASPITVPFSVTATTGPLSGTTANGTFTFDSSSIPASLPGENDSVGLFTDLSFTWNGINYDETTANTGHLEFDAAGNLIGAVFGNDCASPPLVAGSCAVVFGLEEWYFALQPLHPDPGFAQSFFYSVQGDGFGDGTETLGQTGGGGAPEPTTLALLGIGLASIAFSRRGRLHTA